MLQIAVSLSVILGFLSSELLGIASGGLISAGYLAFFFSSPLRIVSTVVLASFIFGIVSVLDNWLFIYGKRRFALCVILGIILSFFANKFFVGKLVFDDVRVVGYMISGLIANDMLKQGILKTILCIIIISALIWLAIFSGVLL